MFGNIREELKSFKQINIDFNEIISIIRWIHSNEYQLIFRWKEKSMCYQPFLTSTDRRNRAFFFFWCSCFFFFVFLFFSLGNRIRKKTISQRSNWYLFKWALEKHVILQLAEHSQLHLFRSAFDRQWRRCTSTYP